MTAIRQGGAVRTLAALLALAAISLILLTGCGGVDTNRMEAEFLEYVNQSGDSFEIVSFEAEPTEERITTSAHNGSISTKENTGNEQSYLITATVTDGTYEKTYETLAELVDDGDHYIFQDKSQTGYVVSFDTDNPPFFIDGDVESIEWDPDTQTCTYTYIKDEGALITRSCTREYETNPGYPMSTEWKSEVIEDISVDFSPMSGTYVSENGNITYTINADGLIGRVTYTNSTLGDNAIYPIYAKSSKNTSPYYEWNTGYGTGKITCSELIKLK